jgi:rfaE bifunctional protein nucleotidyltransferase chain/domain
MGIVTLDTLQALRPQWQNNYQQLVLTNGIFDLLHSGHVRYLEEAGATGDVLVVGLNSDSSTRTLKGPQRPIIPQEERAYLLAALRCVDYVTVFEQRTAEELVATLQPDIYVKGGDYTPDDPRLPEARVVRSYGGQVVLLPYHEGFSTTSLIERLVRLCSDPS